jgi:acyl-CoA thioester hydrolase
MYHSETIFPVRYAETDQMRIVHHSVYPIWFECGRTEYIHHFGMGYDEVEGFGILLPLRNVQVAFKAPARYGQTVVVQTRLIIGTPTRLLFGYTVLLQGTETVCATGTTEHCWVNANMKPVNLIKASPTLYERMLPMFGQAAGE